MKFIDVVFPLNLRPLTYSVPVDMERSAVPGAVVTAELGRKVKKAVVLGPSIEPPGGAGIKPILSVMDGANSLSAPYTRFLLWLAEYYHSTEGAALRTALPEEFFKPSSPRAKRTKSMDELDSMDAPLTESCLTLAPADEEIKSEAKGIMGIDGYRAFLLHARSLKEELEFAAFAVGNANNAILMLPDRADIKCMEPMLRNKFKNRLALYHGGLSASEMTDSINRMLSGEADIVLGTRMAVFAPLRKVSFMAVVGEESRHYKEEGGIRYNGRDAAVMRAYMEGATVLLSSISPSVESVHNARRGKYEMLAIHARQHKIPRVRVIDMHGIDSPVSETLRRSVLNAAKSGGRSLIYINRKGYGILQCRDCGHSNVCVKCGVPLVFHKSERSERCPYCGASSSAKDTCPVCKGHDIRPSGAGMERIQDEFKDLRPVGVTGKQSGAFKIISEKELPALAVGTRAVIDRQGIAGFGVAAIANADAYAVRPDFRAAEHAVSEIVHIADKLASGGELIIQTKNPRGRIYSYLRNMNLKGFYDEELKEREALGYPPFKKLCLITAHTERRLPDMKSAASVDVEIMGPVPALLKKGKKAQRIILKSSARAAMTPTINKISKMLGKIKHTIDMDPVEI